MGDLSAVEPRWGRSDCMSLPEWVDPGILPPGRHNATLEELHERCVAGAANSQRRQALFDVLLTYLDICRKLSEQPPIGLTAAS
ncbi:MAG: hypothetical protein QOD36_137 [Mycobacterium sp.]|nr:hypothetical protein [Mycobacterium sp.]MDT5330861.1 hypothetical protein [Mycobacterium sp.]